jgi:hypothetical protein
MQTVVHIERAQFYIVVNDDFNNGCNKMYSILQTIFYKVIVTVTAADNNTSFLGMYQYRIALHCINS